MYRDEGRGCFQKKEFKCFIKALLHNMYVGIIRRSLFGTKIFFNHLKIHASPPRENLKQKICLSKIVKTL